jgi:hypothetical protein
MNTFTLIIYFVGIAAFIDPATPGTGKVVVFPTARLGTYQHHVLWPHRTYLHIPGASLRADNPADACIKQIGGDWHDGLCSLELRGARLWTQTPEAYSEGKTFKQMPALGTLCSEAPSPKRVYTEGTDPDFVAARFDITGGVASGCNRPGGAFVAQLKVESTYGVLVIERGHGTVRIQLKDEARLTLENRPDAAVGDGGHPTAAHKEEEHYGWYHFMATGDLTCPIKIPEKAVIAQCGDIPGIIEAPTGPPSASGPDCGNTGYP